MINVRIECKGGRFDLKVEGHAGAGSKGNDIVCAAASILAQTAVQEAMNRAAKLAGEDFSVAKVEMGDGNLRLIVAANGASWSAWESAAHTIATGFELLANAYPDHVNFSWVAANTENPS